MFRFGRLPLAGVALALSLIAPAMAQSSPEGTSAAGSWAMKKPLPAPRNEVQLAAVGGKIYVVGGNVQQSVTVKKLRLRRDMKFAENKSGCGDWTLPPPSAAVPVGPSVRDNCSLNEKKWFVLLQLR